MIGERRGANRLAIVGCGYVADFYVKTLANHPELKVLGVMDRDPERAARFAKFHGLPMYPDLDEVLADGGVDMVVNLTNPRSHFDVSRAALLAGKHVYSEKPLAMDLDEAAELVRLSEREGLELAGAPCSLLGETAQTVWKALRDKTIGPVRLVYAELDDGPIHLMNYRSWRSDSGSPWPYEDEFEVGCTLEHAGYYVAWLVAFFGPATSVTSFASSVVPDKGVALARVTPDFSVACITFASGVVARLTCSILAPHDHVLRIIGDNGVLSVDDCWDYGSRVYLQMRTKLGVKAEKHRRLARLVGLGPRELPLVRRPGFRFRTRGANRMDFARGIQEVSAAIAEQRPSRIGARASLHINEIVLAIQRSGPRGNTQTLTTTFAPIAPMPWAN